MANSEEKSIRAAAAKARSEQPEPGRPRKKKPTRSRSRWPAAALARLGKDSDRSIAARFGLSFNMVRERRLALDIPAWTWRRPWTPEEEALIGTMPDEELAEKLGRWPKDVLKHRWVLRIKKWKVYH